VRVLVVGSGGREHALVWALARTPGVDVIASPGNPGMAGQAETEGVAADDCKGILDLALSRKVDLVVVGPEAPLVAGIADMLRGAGVPCFGPGRDGAMLEGSKWFAKDVMEAAGVPSAEGRLFSDPSAAIAWAGDSPGRFVIKADGLAAGKGVFLPGTAEEFAGIVHGLFAGNLGESGRKVVVEERLEGPEVSVLAICNGRDAVVLPPSRDHKRIGEGDTGPNTGGMGAVCPPPGTDPAISGEVRAEVVLPVLGELRARGIDFRGVLYAGLMLTRDGPRVLEFNVRFGDPEAQAVLPMMDDDLAGLCMAAALGEDLPASVSLRGGASACVIVASGGYPGPYGKGYEIEGLDRTGDAIVFHAGTKLSGGKIVTGGGRVLGVTGLGNDLDGALSSAYGAVGSIVFRDMYYRRDIGRTV
jgi:phosphoribosylamine--glycine ligase